LKILITVGLLILAVNLLVVLMVGFVLTSDWVRAFRHRSKTRREAGRRIADKEAQG
jgi:hypothetical protein